MDNLIVIWKTLEQTWLEFQIEYSFRWINANFVVIHVHYGTETPYIHIILFENKVTLILGPF
jgi:hypothetical protein